MNDSRKVALAPRHVSWDWSGLPMHYMGGDPLATHIANGMNMLLPEGEVFFVETFREGAAVIKDDVAPRSTSYPPARQESRHARRHQADHVRSRGGRIDRQRKRRAIMSTTSPAPSTNLQIWNTLRRLPFGNRLFSEAVCFKAPYFRSVHPTITVLRPGRCEVHAPNRRSSRNHLGTYHAIASCNLAELAAGMMTDATVPATHRWIPKAMTVEYVAKAETDMHATAELQSLPQFGDEATTLVVPVQVSTADGTLAVRAEITMYISPRRPAAGA